MAVDAAEIREKIAQVQQETHEICVSSMSFLPEITGEITAHLMRIDRAARVLTELTDAELTAAYRSFRDERLVIAWLHDEAALLEGTAQWP